MSRCSTPLCPNEAARGGRCEECYRKHDRARGTAAERGYNSRRWEGTKRTIRKRDPFCTCDAGDHGHASFACMHLTEVADHYPKTRKQLLEEGVRDPDKPEFCRGLCKSCHSRATAKNPETRGGWNAR